MTRWQAPRHKTQVDHAGGHKDRGHKLDMMANTKTGYTRWTQWRAPRRGTKGRHDGGYRNRGHKVDMIAGSKKGDTRWS